MRTVPDLFARLFDLKTNGIKNSIKINRMNETRAPALFESVPNFSEGRNSETINALRRAVEKTPSVRLIDVHSDADHNRSVFTLIGEAEPLRECILNLVAAANEKIDLNTQRGVHPRVGAVDVVPFIPLRNATMTDAIRLAESTAEAISARFNIPTYLYANAARRPDRTKLSQLRKGNYEKLRGAIRDDPYFEPDFGPRELTAAGATAVGARDFLIAYNVYLNSADVAVAKAVAKKIRESSGGLPALQAVGLSVGGQAQVSTNILDYRATPLKTVFDTVKAEAGRFGTSVARAELVGCLPAAALAGTTPADIGLAEPIGDKILDRYYGGKK